MPLSEEEKQKKIEEAKARAALKKAEAEAGKTAGAAPAAPGDAPKAEAPKPEKPKKEEPPPRELTADEKRAAETYELVERLLKKQFGEDVVTFPEVERLDRPVVVKSERLKDIIKFLRTHPDIEFDSLMCQGGFDTGEQLGVAYHLHSFRFGRKIYVKTFLPRDGAEIDTVSDIFGVANYFEREAWDGFGIVFKGHTRLVRISNPDDWIGHPMRKDYVYPTEYHGVETEREDQFFDVDVGK
ncbi:MAG: NADH-quinone oxidoreductase subunit C [Planctomycetes bacterium]|nr:NADH-quinone oxidoreductase subunit C [Planctomycetota bacterium]